MAEFLLSISAVISCISSLVNEWNSEPVKSWRRAIAFLKVFTSGSAISKTPEASEVEVLRVVRADCFSPLLEETGRQVGLGLSEVGRPEGGVVGLWGSAGTSSGVKQDMSSRSSKLSSSLASWDAFSLFKSPARSSEEISSPERIRSRSSLASVADFVCRSQNSSRTDDRSFFSRTFLVLSVVEVSSIM